MLECELFDPDLFILCPPLICPCAEPVLELVGRTGELLLGLPLLDFASWTSSPDADLANSMWCNPRDSRFSMLPILEFGDPGAEFV